VLAAIDSDVIKTYVSVGLGVGIMTGLAYDAARDRGLVAVPAEFATSPYGIAMIELPAGESLPDVPLVRLRAGRDDAPGTFGLELGHSRRDICRATATVAAASGPAAATGVRVGDTITAIDGKDVTDWRCYLVAPLLTTKVGTSITVTLGRGDTVTLVSVAN